MGNGREARLRALMSQEAARLIVDEGVSDFQTAKRKAAERLKLSEHQLLPRNSEIEEAVRARQRLFQEGPHEQHLRNLRLSAVRAMILLKEFSPRLTGSVLSGTAGPHSDINLHLFADTPEDVILRLMALEIPHRSLEKRLRMRSDS